MSTANNGYERRKKFLLKIAEADQELDFARQEVGSLNRKNAFIRVKDLFEAIEAEFPDIRKEAMFYNDFAEIDIETNAYDDAKKKYKQALEIDPADGYTYLKQARLYELLGDRENSKVSMAKASEAYEKKISQIQGESDTQNNIGRWAPDMFRRWGIVLRGLGEYEKAIKCFNKVILEMNDASIYESGSFATAKYLAPINLVHTYWLLGEYEKAQLTLEEAKSEAEKQGKLEDFCRDLRADNELIPEHPLRFSPGFSSDQFLGDDLLNTERDAHSLAALIQKAKNNNEALTLGIFGEWGTGKSYFLRLLLHHLTEIKIAEIDEYINAETPFLCWDSIYVSFNAWHYAETNMYASIGAHLFKSIGEALYNEDANDCVQNEEIHELVGKLRVNKARISELDNQLQENDLQSDIISFVLSLLSPSKSNPKKRKAEQDKNQSCNNSEAKGHLERKEFSVEDLCSVSPLVWEFVQKFCPTAKDGDTIEKSEFGEQCKNSFFSLRGLWCNLKLLLGDWRYRFFVSATAILIVSAILYSYFYHQDLSHLNIPSVVTSISLPFFPILRKILIYVREMGKNRDEIVRLKHKKQTLRSEKISMLKQYNRIVLGEGLEEYLRGQLSDVRYRDDLGVVSVLHQDLLKLGKNFENIDVKPYKGRDKAPNAKSDSPKDVEVVIHSTRTHENSEENSTETTASNEPLPIELKKDAPRKIKKVVLLIDDLDRCPPERVAEVLQAMHILFSQPLFVVIIAAEPRWLQKCIQIHYDKLFAESETQLRNENDWLWNMTPIQYLEKLVQIPFVITPPGKKEYELLLDNYLPFTEEGQRKAMDKDLVIQSVKSWERVFLKNLHGFFRTPRSALRFANLYRLLRAGLDDEENYRFVGSSKIGGEFEAVAILLAIVCGRPNEAQEILAMIRKASESMTLKNFLKENIQKCKNPEEHEPPSEKLLVELTGQVLLEFESIQPQIRTCTKMSYFKEWSHKVGKYSLLIGHTNRKMNRPEFSGVLSI